MLKELLAVTPMAPFFCVNSSRFFNFSKYKAI